jgi:hypothetical protein
VLRFEFDRIGGRGSLDLRITVHVVEIYELFRVPVSFTSPDLTGSCSPPGVVALGVWASGLPPAPYRRESDYTCDLAIDVLDLGVWAGGLGIECGESACP